MTPGDFGFKDRVSRFISGASSRSKFGFSATPKLTRIAGMFPKRQVPQQIVSGSSEQTDPEIGAPKRVISSLGRLTLDLEIVNNNLDRIASIILQDYKETQDTNKKEIEDFRKRVANRGRLFGKKELGDKKSDVLGAVKKYVGSFFSGAGGAIRALSMFNLMQGILSGDPSKIIGPLLGIGLTYLPAIGAGIAGAVATSLVGKLFGGGAATRAAASAAPAAAGAGGALGRLGKFGGRAALVGGGIALASSIFNRPQEDQSQQRLEELTQQQKASVEPGNLVPIPQDDLRRFEKLNKKFEAALDFLLGKQKEQDRQPQKTGGRGGGGGGGAPPSPMMGGPGIEGLSSFIAGSETGGRFDAYAGDRGAGDPQITGMTLSQLKTKYPDTAVGAYQFKPDTAIGLARSLGMDPNTTVFSPDVQKQLNVSHLNQMGYADYVSGKISKEEFGKRIAQQYRALPVPGTGATFQDQYANRNRALRTDAQFLQALEASKTGAMSGVLPTSVRPTAPAPRSAATATPRAPQTQVTVLPLPTQQQSSQASAVSGGNDTVPSIDTTYPENFLALYSKLIYQIV